MNPMRPYSFHPLPDRLQSQAIVAALLLPLMAPELGRCQAPVVPEDVKASVMARVTNSVTPAIVVGVVNSNGMAFFSYGVRALDTREPVNEDTVFEIGSITKTFTCTVLSQMVLEGSLILTNPVQTYLPDNVRIPSRNGKVITLAHLASHRSGLPRLPTNFKPADALRPYIDYTIQQMYDFLSNYQLPRDPGEAFEYSNVGMGLLGHVLELKSGSDYETLIAERITRPLGMTSTGIQTNSQMAGNWAKGHAGVVAVPSWEMTSAFAGAGALRASARDLLRYVAANMGLVPTSLYRAMTNSHVSTYSSKTAISIGMGWVLLPTQGDQVTWHDGGTYGYSTFAGFRRSMQLGVVVLANSGFQSVNDIGLHLLDPSIPLEALPSPAESGSSRPFAFFRLAQILLAHGKVNQAEDYYRQALTAARTGSAPPVLLEAFYHVAEMLCTQKRLPEAQGLLREALTVAKHSPSSEMAVRTSLLLAQILVQQDRGSEVESRLTRISEVESLLTQVLESVNSCPASASLADPISTQAMRIAALQAWFGREAEHATLGRQMTRWAKDQESAEAAERTAKLVCLRPIADAQVLQSALALARHAVEVGKTNASLPWFHLALGMAEYRNGHYPEAARWCATVAQGNTEAQQLEARTGLAKLYRSMSLSRQGQWAEARQLFSETEGKIKPLPKDGQWPLTDGVDHDDLILWLACKEARELLRTSSD